jgi:hypothetical protein
MMLPRHAQKCAGCPAEDGYALNARGGGEAARERAVKFLEAGRVSGKRTGWHDPSKLR